MKLKTDASGNAVLQDGKPVYTDASGNDLALDAAELYGQVKRLTGENRDHREARKAAEDKLAGFAGIDDPKAAREALETVKSLEGKTKADVEKVRAEVSKSYETKLAELQGKLQATETTMHRELIGGGVARSKFVAEKSALPADLLLPIVGQHLAVENGQVVAKRADGSVIYSRTNPGSPAGLDEALETLVSESPHRDHILKATQKNGSGAAPGATGGAAGVKTIPRAEFDQKTPVERRQILSSGVVPVD
jgi:hypothetical protein